MAERPVPGSPKDAVEKAEQARHAVVELLLALIEEGIVPPDKADQIMDATITPFPPALRESFQRRLDYVLRIVEGRPSGAAP